MNANDKYMAKLLFGSVTGLPYSKKNLIEVVSNSDKYRIYDASLHGYKFIQINNEIIIVTVVN